MRDIQDLHASSLPRIHSGTGFQCRVDLFESGRPDCDVIRGLRVLQITTTKARIAQDVSVVSGNRDAPGARETAALFIFKE